MRQEFAQLQAYLEIMALRMGSRLSFAIDLPEQLQPIAVPPMLLQPLVENAIRHGLEPKIGGGRIEVGARMIPVAEIVCLEATDKYVNVVIANGEALVRMSLRELASRLEGAEFTQVHRSIMVNSRMIDSATRDEKTATTA